MPRTVLLVVVLLAVLVAVLPWEARGQDASLGPAYQRGRHGVPGGHYRHAPVRRPVAVIPPQQHSSFHFQRPYPYHLDYYRMRFGGNYAPYFGNLYGPPAIYSPYYGGGGSPFYGGGGFPVPYEPYDQPAP